MPVSYLKFVEDLSAGVKWLNGYYGRRLRGTYGILSDALMETSRQAFIQRLPGHVEQARDSLDACGHDRDLLFYTGETEEAWLERVVGAWDSYGYASTAQSVKVAVEAWGAATFPTTWVAGNVELVEHNYRPDYIHTNVAWFDMFDPTGYTQAAGAIVTLKNRATDQVWSLTTGVMPQYDAVGLNSKPTMLGNGTTRMVYSAIDTEVINTFSGADKPWTIQLVTQPVGSLNNNANFAWGNSGIATNSAGYVGKLNTTGHFRASLTDDSGVTVTAGSVNPSVALPCIATYTYTGTQITIQRNVETPSPSLAAFDVGAVTPNRVAMFAVPDSVPDTWGVDKVSAALVFNEALSAAQAKEATLWNMARWLGPDSTGAEFTVYISTASCGWSTAAFTYGSGRIYGDGSIYGSNALAKDVAMLKKTINKYKRGSARGRVVVYNTHPGDTVISFLV